MESCKPCIAPIQKNEMLFKTQCPQNDVDIAEMENVPYASTVGSLMCAQVYTRPNIAFIISVLGRYLRAGCKMSYEVSIRY